MKIDSKKIRPVGAAFACGFLACYLLLGVSQHPQPGSRMTASGPPPVTLIITGAPIVFTAVRAEDRVETTIHNYQLHPLDLIETTPHSGLKLDEETN